MMVSPTPAPEPAPSNSSNLPHLNVHVVVFSLRDDQLQVLLVTAPAESYSLPGSLIPAAESIEETATRSVLRLTGLREAYLEQLYTYGEAGRYDVQPPHQRVVSVVYFAIIPAGAGAQGKDECRADWFAVDDLPALVMGQQEIIAYALRRLRYKLEYTAVGFQLLPEQFSLSELQQVYETILGEKLDKRNFRRRILQAGIIEETQYLRSGEGRPARLYRYRPDAVAEVKVRRLFP